MQRSRVRLPAAVRPPYTVFVNGIAQREGVDYVVCDGVLEFETALQKEGRLSVWRWLLGAFGIGTYGRNDQVDVAWETGGRSRIAHALDIESVPDGG
jgi:hypothetical protein